MICNNCGCENAEGALYCEVCGTELAGGKKSDEHIEKKRKSPEDDEFNDRSPFDKNKIIVIALVAAIAIVAAVTAGFLIKMNKDKNEYIPHVDYAPAYSESGGSYTDASETEKTEKQGSLLESTTQKENTTKKESTTKKTSETTAKSTSKKATVSGWVLAENAPKGAKIVQEKWTYDKLLKKTTYDKSPEKEGYTLYEAKASWGDYGSWSSWSTSSASSSDSREVETRTAYRFYAFVCSKCGSRDPYSTPCDNCGTSSTMVWEETYFPFKGSSRSYTDIGGKPRISYNGKYWYFEYDGQSDGQGGKGQPIRKEYRYRDRSKEYTYYYQKTESRESNKKVTASDTVNNVKHYVKYQVS